MRNLLRYESKKRLEFMGLAVGFVSFVGIWWFVGDFLGNGNGLMRLIGLVGGAFAGLTIFGRISDDVDKTYELPSATCRLCQWRNPIPGSDTCQSCVDRRI